MRRPLTIPHRLARIALCTILMITCAKHGCAQSYSQQKLRMILADCGSMRILASHTETLQKCRMANLIPLASPIWDEYRISSRFGTRMHPILKEWKFHNGLDLSCPAGVRVHATAEGVVCFSGNKNGYGKCVVIRHLYGFETIYGHLARIHAALGQRIHIGDVIGFVGSSGMSTGPHLHYEIRKKGRVVEPFITRKQTKNL